MSQFSRTIQKQLYTKLDLFQRDELVKSMCDYVKHKDAIEEQKKAANATWNEAIKKADEAITDAVYTLEHGKVSDVFCRMVITPEKNHVVVYRDDTGEVVEERKMTDDDKIELFDDELPVDKENYSVE
jgi:glycerol-3-phosphate O-acyltransferase